MNIKKPYKELIAFLEANKSKKVSTIMPEIIKLCSAKTAGSGESTSIRNDSKEVVAIYDYYFKRWLPLIGEKKVDFGSKKHSTTGYNSMCKAGVRLWTKQQSDAKKARAQILPDLKAKKITLDDTDVIEAKIEEARKYIEKTELGFETKEQIVEYLRQNKQKLIIK